jgi:hypothetical protein
MAKLIELGLNRNPAETENRNTESRPEQSEGGVREAGAARLERAGKAISSMKESFKSKVGSVWGRIKGGARAGVEAVAGAPEAYLKGFEKFENAKQAIGQKIENAGSAMGDKVDSAFGVLQKKEDALKAGALEKINKVRAGWKGLKNWTKEKGSNMIETAKTMELKAELHAKTMALQKAAELYNQVAARAQEKGINATRFEIRQAQ